MLPARSANGSPIVEAPEDALAAGQEAMVPTTIGAHDRDLAISNADNKDELFGAPGTHEAVYADLVSPSA